MSKQISIRAKNLSHTVAFGKKLGAAMKAGDVISLCGELGAGKTTLVKAIATGLGIPDNIVVCSPSYTLVNEYEGKIPLFHFDFYRLEGAADIGDLGFEEYFEGNGLSIIEWAEIAPHLLPPNHLKISIEIISEDEREIEVKSQSLEYERIIEKLGCAFEGNE